MNITASLQTKNNIYQVVLNYKDINGKKKAKNGYQQDLLKKAIIRD